MDPFKIDISTLRGRLGEDIDLKIEENLEIEGGLGEFKIQGPTKVQVRVENLGEDILATGSAEIKINLDCTRCLKTYELKIVAELSQVYTDDPSEDQDEMGIIKEKIDLQPAIEEAILLEFPFSRVCDPNCLGICQVCGQDLNQKKCDCKKEDFDLRLTKLLEFKDKLNSSDS